MVISLLAPSEDVRGAPDVGVAYVNVPGAVTEMSRVAHHANASRVLELIGAASSFDGVLVDSLFDTGVELAREVVDVPVVGLFWPSVSHAMLIGGRFAILHCHPGPSRDTRGEALILDALASRYGVMHHLAAIQGAALGNLPSKENELAVALADIVHSLGKKSGANSVIVYGVHLLGEINAALEAKADAAEVVVVDATLCGLNALEGMLRQKNRCSRKHYPKTEHVEYS